MNVMKMDAKRSICSVKMIIIIVALVFTLIFSSWDMIRASKKDISAYGVIDMLGTAPVSYTHLTVITIRISWRDYR